jgi:hypothetical protein
MITAKLKRVVPLEPNAQLDVKMPDGEAKSFDVIEFKPGPNKRYMVTVEIGNMPPKEATMYMQKLRDHLKGFFPEGTLLVSPMRNGQPTNGIYEIDIQ